MKKVFRIGLIIFAVIILLLTRGCTKEEPEISTQSATNFSITGATLNGTVNPNGLSTLVTFEYGTTTSYDSSVTAAQSPVTGNSITNVSANISGLTLGTIYHYRVKAENSHWTVYGSDNEFDLGFPPLDTTLEVTNLKATRATLNGIVTRGGTSTTVTFEYGTSTSYGNIVTASQSPVTGNICADVSADISGLTMGTIYHFRVIAENSFGTVYGNDVEFTTLTPFPPTVNTHLATNITWTTAKLTGDVVANDLPSVVIFEYGTTTNYGQAITSEPSLATGDSIVNVSAIITGLTRCTTYHFRIQAENSLGVVYGSDRTFATKQIPTLITTSISGITATTAISGGNITDEGCSDITGRGVEWTANFPPTCIRCLHYYTHDGTGTGSFTSTMTGLIPSTTYYVRAYATNSAGKAYGKVISFRTPASGK